MNDVSSFLTGKELVQFKYTVYCRPLYISIEATNQHFIIRNGFQVSLTVEARDETLQIPLSCVF